MNIQMKNTKIKFITVLFILLFTSLPIFAQEFVYVSVEKADLKEGTGFFANKVTEIEYGTKLIVLENTIKDKWIKVVEEANQKTYGWILSSNVTKKKIVNAYANTGASNKEIALAGKGFSEGQVSSGKIDYDELEKIEEFATTLDMKKLQNFISEGKLNGE